MSNSLIHQFREPRKQLALLIDPDSYSLEDVRKVALLAQEARVNFIFVGGSLLVEGDVDACIATVKESCDIPVVIFPGSPQQVSANADGLLFLSLISGRNPELLIGQHVVAAPMVKQSGLQVLPTGYMLVDCGRQTTASYISGTAPLPWDKPGIAACTAMAGEMLGLQLMYLDGGSGAERPISKEMIAAVRKSVNTPLIVGGGLRHPEDVYTACKAGADVVVIGNAIEKDASLLHEMAAALYQV